VRTDDGNLSRHLQVLQVAKLVEISKASNEIGLRRSAALRQRRRRYLDYVAVLEQVILDAAAAVKADADPASGASSVRV